MAISLYDISISSYLQILGGITGVLQKGAEFSEANDLDLAQLVETSLCPDMLPFRFQVISVAHHSLGAIKGLREGVFAPPPPMPDLDYKALQGVVADTIAQLKSVTREEIDGFEGNDMKFKMGDFEIPFIAENFILSFSLPNLYFHATTVYDILRIADVPVGKMDFHGEMRVGNNPNT